MFSKSLTSSFVHWRWNFVILPNSGALGNFTHFFYVYILNIHSPDIYGKKSIRHNVQEPLNFLLAPASRYYQEVSWAHRSSVMRNQLPTLKERENLFCFQITGLTDDKRAETLSARFSGLCFSVYVWRILRRRQGYY